MAVRRFRQNLPPRALPAFGTTCTVPTACGINDADPPDELNQVSGRSAARSSKTRRFRSSADYHADADDALEYVARSRCR